MPETMCPTCQFRGAQDRVGVEDRSQCSGIAAWVCTRVLSNGQRCGAAYPYHPTNDAHRRVAERLNTTGEGRAVAWSSRGSSIVRIAC